MIYRELEKWGLQTSIMQSSKKEDIFSLQQPASKKQKTSKGTKRAAAASVIADKSQTSIGSFFKKKM